MGGECVGASRNSKRETETCSALRFLNNSFEAGTELAGIGRPSGDGKWLLFPQHCPAGFDDLDETGGRFFSMPHVHSFPLQHGHEQWLEAADNSFQPLLRVNGCETFSKKDEINTPIILTICPLPFDTEYYG